MPNNNAGTTALHPRPRPAPGCNAWTIDAGLVLVAVIWGINFPLVKIALREMEPLVVNAIRYPLAALTVTLLLRMQGRRLMPRRRHWPRVLFLALVGHVIYQVLFIYALDWTLTGNAALILATAPVWVVFLSTAMGKERYSAPVLHGALITLAGMVLLVANGSANLGASLRGDLLMIVATVFWSLYTVLARRAIKRHGALETTGWSLWAATPFVFGAGVPGMLRGGLTGVSVSSWMAVAYAGVLTVAVGYFVWYRAVGVLGQSRTTVYANLVPVIALLAAWAWLGETPTAVQLVGTVVILAGLVVARRGPKMRAGDRMRTRAPTTGVGPGSGPTAGGVAGVEAGTQATRPPLTPSPAS